MDALGCQCGAGMPCQCLRSSAIDSGIDEPVIVEIMIDPAKVN